MVEFQVTYELSVRAEHKFQALSDLHVVNALSSPLCSRFKTLAKKASNFFFPLCGDFVKAGEERTGALAQPACLLSSPLC